MSEVEAKVAAIISEAYLALNAGAKTGVEVDDIVQLFRAVEVVDPETQEPLGRVNLPKLTLRITQVQERLSVAVVTTPGKRKKTGLGLEALFSTSAEVPQLARIVQHGSSESVSDPDAIQVKLGERAVILLTQKRDRSR